MKTLLITTAAAVALAASPAVAKTFKFGHVGAPGSLFEASAENFAACANERLPEGDEVQVFGSSQLGKDKELLQKLKLGQVDFALPSSVMSSVDDRFGVFEMPYIIADREHMKRVRDAMMETTFQPAANENGYRILGVWENGFRNITNNVRPINTPEDLAGIKLRTPNGAWRVKMFQQYGANPTPMAFSDVFTALQTGVIDGQENPYAQIASAKFGEVQTYMSNTGHVYTPAYLVTSTRGFDGLSDEQKTAITECAVESQDFVLETAAQMESDLLADLSGQMEVNDADKQAFIDASKPIYDEFANSVEGGQALIDEVQKLASGS